MKVSIEMNFSVSALELSVPIKSVDEVSEYVGIETGHCEAHGEHDFVLIPFTARFRAPIIDPDIRTDFDNLDPDKDYIDYFAILGNCAITFDEDEDVKHIAAKVFSVMSETYSGELKQSWENREDDDNMNVNCKVSDEDLEEVTEFVQDWLDENPDLKEAILAEYRKRGLKGKEPASKTRQ